MSGIRRTTAPGRANSTKAPPRKLTARPPTLSRRPRGWWHLVLLALVGGAALVAGVIEIGTPTSSARVTHQIVTAEQGVVQSTVTGTGNVEPDTDVSASFRTSGTLDQVDVKVGQHVQEGQLLATLDPTAAQLSVDQAQLNLTAAEDQLTSVENGTATGSSGSGSGSSSNASTSVAPSAEFVSDTATVPASKAAATATPATTTTTVTETTTTTTPRTTTGPARTTPPTTKRPTTKRPTTKPSTTTTTTITTTPQRTARPQSTTAARTTAQPTTTTTSTTPSPSSIASAQASVDSAQLNLRTAELALGETRLYAPAAGTVVSLESVSPGDAISAGSGSASSSSSGSGTGSSSSATSASAAGSSAGSLGGSSSSSGASGSSSSSSSGFAEIVNTGSMAMTVAFSESDISKVKVGQAATVTLDALTGVELAAHVSAISTLGTTSSGVVSYNATLSLDQTDPRVKPGMSASASVITGQAQGVTLPDSAVTGTGSVTTVQVQKNGKTVSTPVVVGLRGDSRTQIVSGLAAGSNVVVTVTLPSLSSGTGSSAAGSSGTLGGTGLGGGGAGGGFGGGGGFRRLLGGGGGGGFGGGG